MSTYYAAPREKRYHKYKKVLYLEPPTNGSKTVRTRVTTIVPPPAPIPSPSPPPVIMLPEPTPAPPPVFLEPLPPPPPPPAPYIPPPPPPEPEQDTEIEVIAVDVDPDQSTVSGRSSKSSKSSSRSSKSSKTSRHSSGGRHSRDREVYIERERLVPVRVPVPYHVHHVEIEQQQPPQQDSFRYIEAPRRYEPQSRRNSDQEIIIEDHRHRKYIRDC
ncbi:hypothetical protein F4820DRAFT_444871 [Hypoxylon rubiginosum]|uniref:Uncharacterized protein n=1 Tax=Hypoxylon rubiginosum TaxID=110542 RepID=A0ACB9ZBZ1_9PEZI|nr:hypothetical protein F4820DRAFT_444871 [Hypoxylon rubiginosum]